MMLADHFSVSQLRTYLGCPLAYRFRYIDRVETRACASALALGKAVHAAAELLHRHLMDAGPQEPQVYRDAAARALARQFDEFDVQLKDDESRDALADEAARLLDLYLDHRTRHDNRIIAAERKIECDLVNVRTAESLGVPFVGYLDVVELDADGRLVVADLKTAGRSWTQAQADTDLQLSCYALLVLQEDGELPGRLRIDALVRNKTPKMQSIETTRTDRDLVRFWSLARAVWSAIAAGHFHPNPSWLCAGCEYAASCEQWGLQPEPEDVSPEGAFRSVA